MKEGDGHAFEETPVSVDQIYAYLQSRQWFEDGKIRSVATIWHRQNDEAAEVVLPFSYVKDFKQRVRDALSAIASFEQRSVGNVINDIKRLLSSVITIRVVHADTKDGTIPIGDGVLLISKAKDLLAAAAQAVYSNRRHFSGPTSKDARNYLDSLLLGQTEIGSYVVNVIAPNQENLPLDQPDAAVAIVDSLDLGQAITSKLVTGLDALSSASAKYEDVGELKVFDAAVYSGASANLCDALLGFSGEKNNRRFEVIVTASSGPMFESKPRKFNFEERQVQILKKVSEYYKDDYVLPDRILTGHITKLVRQKGETEGVITLEANVGDIDRKIRVSLMGDDYHLAVIAHDRGQTVRVQGDVHIKARTAELLMPKNFGVIRMDDLL
ncbi:hypothetical protein LL965_21300 [Xanthomonas cassavae CFBP 4642]|uniref:Uncharacterized protein n=1 Tax=Xanthomonas cassavae CFBP 4642 TaxID=1219375 RepID=A0ABS8HJU4_9XANT|nr:hypothetical protein [Xanthomonas cassavae]MCC4622469.1 hypothetical protein [Xanthomonas cassavae CFBP 4642]